MTTLSSEQKKIYDILFKSGSKTVSEDRLLKDFKSGAPETFRGLLIWLLRERKK